MKMNRAWKIRLGALCLTGLCLGTGAALAAGDADDPLVTLSYLNETVLPKLLSQTDEKAKVRQTELANQLSQVMAQGGGGELYSGGALVRNHLYLATMSDHYLVAGNSTVKVLARGGYRVS